MSADAAAQVQHNAAAERCKCGGRGYCEVAATVTVGNATAVKFNKIPISFGRIHTRTTLAIFKLYLFTAVAFHFVSFSFPFSLIPFSI